MAIYYIDPSTGTGTGVGSFGDPFASWSEVTWAAGNSYLQKAGTTHNSTSVVQLGAHGTVDNRIYLGTYGGTDRAILTRSTAGNIFYTVGFNYLTIENLEFTGESTAVPTYIDAVRMDASDNLIVKNCVARDNNGNGFAFGLDQDNVLTEDLQAIGNGANGIAIKNGGSNITMRRAIADGNGAEAGAHGLTQYPSRSTFTSGWSGAGPIYNRASASYATARVINRTAIPNVVLVNAGATATPASGEFGETGGQLYVNFGGTDANTITIITTAGNLSNIIWEDCISKNNLNAVPASAEGHGFAGDDGSHNITWLRCEAYNNQGHGFNINFGYDNTYISCISRDHNLGNQTITTNKSAFHSNDAGNNVYYNCTASNYSDGGFDVSNPITANNHIYNCISVDNDTYGFVSTATNAGTLHNSCSYNTGTGVLNYVDGGGNITTNPLLATDSYPQLDSPCIGAGAWTGAIRLDKGGRPFKRSRPSIGAWEVANRDEVNRDLR